MHHLVVTAGPLARDPSVPYNVQTHLQAFKNQALFYGAILTALPVHSILIKAPDSYWVCCDHCIFSGLIAKSLDPQLESIQNPFN
jgi:hypothetical protein